MEGALLLCTTLENQEAVDWDFLVRLRETVDARKFNVMFDLEAFTKTLDEAVLIIARQLKDSD